MSEKYTYDGPVMKFDTCIKRRWSASTYAQSPSKAKSNLAFRFKKENGFTKDTKIILPGEVKLVS